MDRLLFEFSFPGRLGGLRAGAVCFHPPQAKVHEEERHANHEHRRNQIEINSSVQERIKAELDIQIASNRRRAFHGSILAHLNTNEVHP